MSDKKPFIKSASPKIRKFARELGADINQVEGSNRKGRVSEDDIKLFVKINPSINIDIWKSWLTEIRIEQLKSITPDNF